MEECETARCFLYLERFGFMPGSPITAQHDHILQILFGKFLKKHIHALCVAIQHDQKAWFAGQRLYRTIGITVLPDMMAGDAGADPLFAPAVFRFVDSTTASLILKHQPDFVENFPHFCDLRVNFFEALMTSSSAFFGCLLRGITFLHLWRRRT